MSRRWVALAAFALALGCAGQSDAIARGQRYYEENQYERALAIWRDVERRGAALAPLERTRYAYLRGMTDYRLGFREDARHWLAIAKANYELAPDGLLPSWNERLDAALMDLHRRGRTNAYGDAVQTIAGPGLEPAPSSWDAAAPSVEPPTGPSGADAGASVTAPSAGAAAHAPP